MSRLWRAHKGNSGEQELEMTLYCWEHNEAHSYPIEDIEEAIYCLGWMERVGHLVGVMEPEIARTVALQKPMCLRKVLLEARDPELGQDAILQGIRLREAAE